jgi:ankyrin repeat protein
MQDDNPGRIEVKIYELAAFYKGIIEDDTKGTLEKLNKNIEFATCVDKKGRNALMYALYAGANGVVKVLLNNNLIPPMAVDSDNMTAYDWAILGGNIPGQRLVERWIEQDDLGF